MNRKLLGAMLLLLASTGCRACSRCSDNLPPVLDGPYSHSVGRAGSAFGGVADARPLYQAEHLEQDESGEQGYAEQAEYAAQDEFATEEGITDPPADQELSEEMTGDSMVADPQPDRFAHPAVTARSQVLQFVRTAD